MKNKATIASKPYNRCLSCPHRQQRCDGPRTSAMPLLRWCEFMRDMKEANGLTNQEIADKTGVSIRTIDRLMAMNCENDIMRETARLIEDAIIGSSNQYPCYLAFEEANMPEAQKLSDAMRELERLLTDNQDYRAALENIHASYKAEIDAIRASYQAEIDAVRASYKAEIDTLRADAKKQVDYLTELRIKEGQEAQKKIDNLSEQVAMLQRDKENLWAENNRKSKVVDMFLEKQNVLLEKK